MLVLATRWVRQVSAPRLNSCCENAGTGCVHASLLLATGTIVNMWDARVLRDLRVTTGSKTAAAMPRSLGMHAAIHWLAFFCQCGDEQLRCMLQKYRHVLSGVGNLQYLCDLGCLPAWRGDETPAHAQIAGPEHQCLIVGDERTGGSAGPAWPLERLARAGTSFISQSIKSEHRDRREVEERGRVSSLSAGAAKNSTPMVITYANDDAEHQDFSCPAAKATSGCLAAMDGSLARHDVTRKLPQDKEHFAGKDARQAREDKDQEVTRQGHAVNFMLSDACCFFPR